MARECSKGERGCEDWVKNIDILNGPAQLAQARNPQYGIWSNLKPFKYCPWCGWGLAEPLGPPVGKEPRHG